MDKGDLLPVGEVARRAGITVPTLRFYEDQGLVRSTRTAGNQRRFARHVLRRIAYVRAAQRFGLTLSEIREALDTLPPDRAPTKRDWTRLSSAWRAGLQRRIDELVALRDASGMCVGCGCLSTSSCPIYNPEDVLGARGPGSRRWLDGRPVGDDGPR
jgi:MerR family redox-sensitive transcriptional activator SoxR